MDTSLDELVLKCNVRIKELYEVRSFVSTVFPYFEEYGVAMNSFVDLFCGNGLLGMYLSLIGKTVLAIDVRKSSKYRRLLDELRSHYRFSEYSFRQKNILDDAIVLTGYSAVVSIHACGVLTDRLLECALYYSVPFAVMTCCHKNIAPYFRPKDMPRKDCGVRLYHDRTRLRYIRENGFTAVYTKIDRRITKANYIIIGIPEKNAPIC